jgi:hypothetical protein
MTRIQNTELAQGVASIMSHIVMIGNPKSVHADMRQHRVCSGRRINHDPNPDRHGDERVAHAEEARTPVATVNGS